MPRRPAPSLSNPARAGAAGLLTGALLLSGSPAAAEGAAEPDRKHDPVTGEPYAGYLFTYMTGEGTPDGEQVHFALSDGDDPLNWYELNGGEPVLTSDLGEEGVRDPFVVRSPEDGTFYLVATDLRIHGDWDWDRAVRHGSHSLMVWESDDLVNWSDQREVEVAPPDAGNTWAPEAHWDSERGQFVVYWASALYGEDDPDRTGDAHQRMMHATTTDFEEFSEPEVWHDPGHAVIDSTVVEHGDSYFRYTKDERDPSDGHECAKHITAERSDDLLDTSWVHIADCIGQGSEDSPGIDQGEGPTVFASNSEDKWYLFIDEFTDRGYVPFETTDLASGEWSMVEEYSLPESSRHGTVMPITQAEHDRLSAAWGTDEAPEPATAAPATGAAPASDTDPAAGTEPPEGNNPALPGLTADPDISYADGRYYIYPTTDGIEGWGSTDFSVWSSENLVDWTDEGVILDLESDVDWASENAWAPAMEERDGRYYFYYTAEQQVGVAVADSPTGPFTDSGSPLVEENPDGTGQAIDPAVFTDHDGQPYLMWGNGSAWIVPLNDDMVSFDESGVREITDGLDDFREGLFLVERDGRHHMTYSIDDTRSEDYRVGYATADSPMGPYTSHGVILEKDADQGILGTGHNSMVQAPDSDDWYIVYHRFAVPDGDGENRETAIDEVSFGEDGLMEPVTPTHEGIAPR